MKSLLYTVFIIAAAFAAFDYFVNPVGEKILFTHLNKTAPQSAAEPAPQELPPAAPAETTPTPAPPAPEPAKPAPTPAPAPAEAAVVAEPGGFVQPKYESMQDLTLNWSKIPPSAFPRPLTLLKATVFKLGAVGSSSVAAGTKVTATAFQAGKLTLALSATSTAKAEVAMDDTDFKKSLLEGYETWKVRRTASLRALHERKLAEAKSGGTSQPAASGSQLAPDGKPVQEPNGAYPLLVAHLKSGQVTEVKAENIRSWSEAVPATHQGKPAWNIKVSADVNTIFGLQISK
jgi:hypothetical protein